jgi:hypothetical protein
MKITITNAHMRATTGIPWVYCPYADANNMPFLASIGYHVVLTLNLPYSRPLVLLYTGKSTPIAFPLK